MESSPPEERGGVRPSEEGTPDARCVREALEGRTERFEELVERYAGAVFSVVLPYVRDAHRAEDLAQEVFLNAYHALHQLRQADRFLPWLLQIARHRAAREARRQAARPERPLSREMEFPAPEPSPDTARAADVLARVEELDEPYRHTVLLKYQQGLSCKAIAEREGVALGTVTSRLTRALALLRLALGVREAK